MGRAATIAAAFGGTLPPGVTGTNERCTLIVSNLNTDVRFESSKAPFHNLDILTTFSNVQVCMENVVVE
jgi:hypothetical protein